MKTLASLFRGPVAYVPHSGWPGWAVLPAAAGIFALSIAIGVLAGVAYNAFAPGEVGELGSAGSQLPAMPFAVGFAVAQVCIIIFTIVVEDIWF